MEPVRHTLLVAQLEEIQAARPTARAGKEHPQGRFTLSRFLQQRIMHIRPHLKRATVLPHALGHLIRPEFAYQVGKLRGRYSLRPDSHPTEEFIVADLQIEHLLEVATDLDGTGILHSADDPSGLGP